MKIFLIILPWLAIAIGFLLLNFFVLPKYKRHTPIPQRDIEYEKYFPALETWNLCGFTLIDTGILDYRTMASIQYHFFIILGLPIVPMGCVLASEGMTNRINHKRSLTNYTIYSSVKWNACEILSIYIVRWSVIIIIGCLLYLFSLI